MDDTGSRSCSCNRPSPKFRPAGYGVDGALTLLIAGGLPSSTQALQNLREACIRVGRPDLWRGVYVVDMFHHPEEAVVVQALCAPVLLWVDLDGNVNTWYGDFADRCEIARFLNEAQLTPR